MSEILFLSFIIGIISIDTMKVGQFMFSRPLIVGSITGFILGDFYLGIKIGVILELFWIRVIPVGTYYPPDTVITTALSTALTIYGSASSYQDNLYIILSIMVSIPVGIIYKSIQIRDRKIISEYNKKVSVAINNYNFNLIDKLVFYNIFKEFFLTFVIFYLGFHIFITLFRNFYFVDFLVNNSSCMKGINYAVYLLPMLGLAQLMDAFIKKK